MKKKLLASLLALCGLTSFAVEPVAVWNGDFTETTKGDYTLSANGNTVAADGSSITISTAKGVSVKKTAGGNIGDQASTVIIKYTNFTPPTNSDAQVLIMNHTANTSYKDFIGAASISGGNIHGIWQNTTWGSNKTSNGAYGSALTDTKTFAFSWAQNGTVGAYFWMDGANKNGWSTLHGNLQVDGVWVGGPNESTTLKPATGMKVLAIAVFDSRISDAEIAAYEFPAPPKKVEPLMLLNIHNGTAVDGWLNHTQDGGPIIPNSGSLTTNGISFVTSSEGNFYKQRASGTSFKSGEFIGLDGKTYDSIASEVAASLNLPAGIVFDNSVYNTGVMNGGKVNHTATISGLDDSAKYLLYIGCGRDHADADYQSGFKFETSGCTSVEELAYVNTDSTSYQTGSLNNDILSTTDSLLIVRAKGIKPVNGSIQFKMVGARSSLNFLAVAKVNDVEEPDETETTNYSFGKYLTTTYQDTGWNTTLTDIKAYGAITGTMAGGYMDNRPTPSTGVRFADAKDGSDDVLEFQMQTKNDVHLKAVKVYLKESASGIQIRAVGAGVILNGGTVGDNITSWGNELSTTLNGNGYSVASVSLSITKPVDKSVKGTIDEVATAHSEDYTSNTITAKVTIENEGEYKGEAVLVYMLDEKQYTGEITDGSALITLEGLEREKVYRGTLALGQKIGEDVTVIEGTEQPVALYQGEQKFVWIASPFKIQDAMLVNEAQGLTIENPFEDPDYIDLCDSEFTVSISASEAVDAENDAALDGTEQGGVRIAQTSSGLKLQVVVDGAWTDFANAAVDTTYTLKVKFHYEKSQEGEMDATSVTYALDSATKTSTNPTGKLKVTEIFVSDGTNLSNDMLGACQLDKAVIVDIEIEPGDEVVGIEADSDEKAQEIAAKLKVGISEAVAAVLTTAEQQEAYRAYFKIIAVKAEDGSYTAQVVFADGVESDIEKNIADAIDDVVESFNTGAAVKIAAKPGLYYGVKRGESPDKLDVEETTLATSDKVTITITKPDNSKSHFYRIIVSPTPSETK